MEKQLVPFGGRKLNLDDDRSVKPLGDSEYRMDIVYPNGDSSGIESRRALTEIPITLIPGTNIALGGCKDIENNAEIIFYYNSTGHSIVRIYSDNTVEVLSEARTEWNFQSTYPIQAFIVGTGDQAFLVFNDRCNYIRCVNIKNLIDNKYYYLKDADINLLKPAPIYSPTFLVGHLDTKPNKIKGKIFQVAYNYVYEDGLESTISHYSAIPFDFRNEFINGLFVNKSVIGNVIILTFTATDRVKKINVYVRVVDIGTDSTVDVSGTGISGSWMYYDTIDNSVGSSSIDYQFYNDRAGSYVDPNSFYLYDNIPPKAGTICAINGDRILIGEPTWKYSNISNPEITLSFVSVLHSPSASIWVNNGTSVITTNPATNIIYVRGVGTTVNYSLIITKLIDGKIDSKEVLQLENYTALVSGIYQDNTAVCDYFVSEINTKSKYTLSNPSSITALKIAGGNPSKIEINYSNYEESKYLAAIVFGGDIYNSSDYGTTWIAANLIHFWKKIAMSESGQFQTAVCSGSITGDALIYTSSDFGKTWAVSTSLAQSWNYVCMSADGKLQSATCDKSSAVGSGYIYNSSDYGKTWVEVWVQKDWVAVVMSLTGLYRFAIISGGWGITDYIYKSSDNGVTWSQVAIIQDWVAIAMSASGQYIVASNNSNDFIYVSSNYGVTWVTRCIEGYWGQLSISYDGKNIMARDGTTIYNSTDYGVTWVNDTAVGIKFPSSRSISDKIQVSLTSMSIDSGVTWETNNLPYVIQDIVLNTKGALSNITYKLSLISSIPQPKYLSFKDNSQVQLGYRYYDKDNVCGAVQPCDAISIPINGGITTDVLGFHTNYIKYQITHLPPDWAVAWQMMYAQNKIINSFVIPMLMYDYLGITCDIESDNTYTKINLDQALARVTKDNVSLNTFDVKKGDKVLIRGYGLTSVYELANVIDSEVLYIDTQTDKDGKVTTKIVIPSLTTHTEYANFKTRYVYYVEFYRTQSEIDPANLIYYEAGSVLPITGGYHTASWVTGVSGTKQDQTASVPAIGLVDFGDIYRLYYHFTDLITPIYANIESRSASLLYPSKSIALGRYGIVDEKQVNKQEEVLIYGNLLKQGDLNYNEINKFNNPPEYLDSRYGKITGIVQQGNTIHVYQETKMTSIYLNAIETTLADGSTQMNYSPKVLGTRNPLPHDVGCSDLGSIANNLYATYHWDQRTSAWYRFSQDGLKNITFDDLHPESSAKMKAYGMYISKLINTIVSGSYDYKINSCYDPVKEMYVFTLNQGITYNITLAFHEPTNSWMSWYSFHPEFYFSFNSNRFLHCYQNKIYEHHISASYVNTGVIQFHFNYMPAFKKTFHTMELGSDDIWCPSTAGDIVIDENSVLNQNENSKQWSYAKMSSYLNEHLARYKEGKRSFAFLRNQLNKKCTLGTKTDLKNGETLKGNVMSVTLRNLKTTINSLKYVIIGYQNSK